MTTITATNMEPAGAVDLTEVTLNGSSDVLTFNPSHDPVLMLRNDTGSPVSPTIVGAGAGTRNVRGAGAIDFSGGFAVGSIADGDVVAIRLRSIENYLAGAISISSGSGLVASLLEF
ncbi:hypothetical protein [Maritimibacter alexandrii]|uniref:hypothetical protein n=1 Tax=Maritimibacter alexandrii TaxID=2570355 RepID=UPI0011082E4A|nr:hypothetical protein [Maritimibacter alexandrii]